MMLLLFNVAIVAFMLLPVLIIVWMSFTPQAFFILPFDHFSLRWYEAALAHEGFRGAFLLSLRRDGGVATLAVVLSILSAYALARLKGPGAKKLDRFVLSLIPVPHGGFGIALLQMLKRL